MSAPAPLLDQTALEASTLIAADLMAEIQGLVDRLWVIDYDIPGGGGTLTGNPNNLDYSLSQTYQDTFTITPAIPAYTITPGYTVPAVVIFGATITPETYVGPIMSPAVPAVTAGYSTSLGVSANAQGISNALTPLFSSVTFTSGVMGVPNSSDLATETVTYNLDQLIEGSAIRITGSAGFYDLSVNIEGVGTNFGNIGTGPMNLSVVPNIPVMFDAIIAIPSYNSPDSISGFNDTSDVAYQLFPQTDSVSVSNLSISDGVQAIADFINDDLLQYLTDFWNDSVVPLYTAVGLNAPQAPSQTLANTISKEAASTQNEINSQAQSGLNSLLKDELNTIQPYVQALTAATWDYQSYPISQTGYYESANLSLGLFSGVNASYCTFTDANLSDADFSYANLTGANFSGANLSGTNFTGATGAPTSSALSSALLAPTIASSANEFEAISTNGRTAREAAIFSNAVIFGANFTSSNLDPSGAFYDANTQFAAGYDPTANGLQYWSAPQFVAGNNKLIKAYGTRVDEATDDFSHDAAPCRCPNKDGIRTDVVTGQLALDGFNEWSYFRSLPQRTKGKFIELFSNNPELNRADTLAFYKIAKKSEWTREDKGKYVFSNNDLITRYGDSPQKAVAKARSQYLKQGFFQQRLLNSDAMYEAYASSYPSVVFDSGVTYLDQGSLAEYFLNSGYQQGHVVPIATTA